MKKFTLTITILILITAILLTGCDVIFTTSEDGDTGSGNLETRQYDFSEFTGVDIGYAFRYEIEQSDTYSISITADDNIFEQIQVKQEGQTLEIGIRSFFSLRSVTLEASITMPRLTGLESSGATRGTVRGFSSDDDLYLNVSGASEVNFVDITTGDFKGDISGASKLEGGFTAGDVDLLVSGTSEIEGSLVAHSVEYDVSGAGKLQLNGSATDIIIDASGMSRIRLDDFTVNNADITLSGGSSCKIDVSGRIDIDLSGLSELEYTGQPVLGSISLSGGSQVKDENGDRKLKL